MPSAMLPLSEEYFRRIEAVEFAVKSDDGKEPRNLKKADLVLVGVSRTSKTPLSTYLASAASRSPTCPSPSASPSPPSSKSARKTASWASPSASISSCEIRRARLRQLGMPVETNYGLREHVREEVEYAHSVFRAHPAWPVHDVTGRAIEETAGIIVAAMKQRGRSRRGSPGPRGGSARRRGASGPSGGSALHHVLRGRTPRSHDAHGPRPGV
jgi:regulator of PEP synthase PpsR (kinase-PPPase family)